MVENVTNAIVSSFGGTVPSNIIIFFVSMLPILELRGGMIAAKLLEVPLLRAFIICYIGNIVPIPFILLFIRKIFDYLRRFEPTRKLIEKIIDRSMKKSDKVLKYKTLGLLAVVAIPLPGTGGWTGALIAALLDLRMKKALPAIALGVLIADLLMAAISYGLIGAVIG